MFHSGTTTWNIKHLPYICSYIELDITISGGTVTLLVSAEDNKEAFESDTQGPSLANY